METSAEPPMDGSDPPTELAPDHDLLLTELESLRRSHRELQSQSAETEETLSIARRQRDDCLAEITNLSRIIEGICDERDRLSLRVSELEESVRREEDESVAKFEEDLREKEGLRVEIEVYREKFEALEKEREERVGFLSRSLESIRSVKEGLVKVIENVDEDNSITITESFGNEVVGSGDLGLDPESIPVWEEIMEVRRLVDFAESRVRGYKETRKKEKKQLESSVVSLTEENRDVSSLLRVALVEKESVERSLNKLKGNAEQKRVPLLQFAERGLQRVGFGFMMGSGGTMEQQVVESSGASSTGSKSDAGSDCEEEVVSVASTVERIMKNLRLEISQLRASLDEARSDNERLQSLTTKQSQQIFENTLYIKELEERERLLAQNIEDLLIDIKDMETEVARWREACELEVEAGKNEVDERDKVVTILQQELEKTKTALEISNGKLKLKEDLAAAAMAAQAAAEKSLQLADSRAAGLRERIEELTRQLEEADSRERNGRKRVRDICWPWRALKNPANHAAARFPSVRRMLPEMQSLIHYSV